MLLPTPRVLQSTPMKRQQMPSPSQKSAKSHKRNLRHRFWQPGFYDFNIYNEEKLLEKLNYVHHNPVRAGLVLSPGAYKWSSYRLYFAEGKGFFEASAPKSPGVDSV